MSNPDSLTPPQGNSRSSSPNSSGSGPQQRIVSGSLKDRIAKFNNPSAPPPIPKQHIPSSSTRGGLIGNRIPGLDPKSVGHVPTATRRVSENRGLIGNRIPSMGSSGNINSISNQFTGQSQSSGTTPALHKPAANTARSTSPAGSVDSSTASATLDSSTSPITSRSSSPPTSPGVGGGVPPSLLAATLPGLDDSSAGTATPSSTRADIGDAVSELSLSMPSTPLAGTTPPLPAPEYDLVAPNLKLATANAAAEAGITSGAPNSMVRGLSASSAARSSFAPSISSSLATQSRGSEEETQMMDDVSGISTPTGTPRAAHRELGEGSVVGDGSVMGDNDVEELGNKLVGLGVTPASPDQTPSETDMASGDWPHGSVSASDPPIPDIEEDPNQAADLDDLKAGKLATTKSNVGQDETSSNPMEHAAAGAMAQNVAEHYIAPEDKKTQGGVAGQFMEDYETADSVEMPQSESGDQNDEEDDLNVREATPSISDRQIEMEQKEKQGLDSGQKGSTAWFEAQYAEKKARKEKVEEQDKNGEGDEHAEVDYAATPKSTVGEVSSEPEKETQEPESATPTPQTQQQDHSATKEDVKVEEEKSVSSDDEDILKSIETPTVPSTTVDEPVVTAVGAEVAKEDVTPQPDTPVQLHFEPAPIAQPATEEQDLSAEAEADPDRTPAADIEAPSFPTPPTADPDVEDPVEDTPKNNQEQGDTLSVGNIDESAGSTPVDQTFLKSFPTVPDEEKPRVEVHVSSPATTPQKAGARRASTDAHAYGRGDPTTPLARLPGHSKSLSTSNADAGIDGGSPEGSSSNLQGSTSLSSINDNDVDATPQATRRLSKRASTSTRRSPKSPLLDDEDPGDFEPGQDGWAVVTKWVIVSVLILQLMTNLVLALKGS